MRVGAPAVQWHNWGAAMGLAGAPPSLYGHRGPYTHSAGSSSPYGVEPSLSPIRRIPQVAEMYLLALPNHYRLAPRRIASTVQGPSASSSRRCSATSSASRSSHAWNSAVLRIGIAEAIADT